MPPVREQVVAGPLANVSVQYRNTNYIADRVFPIIDKVGYKAKIARYLKGAWFRDEAGIRGPGSRANRGGIPTDYLDIATTEYAFASPVTDEDRDAAKMIGGPPLQPDQDAIEFATDKVDLKKEIRVANMIKTSAWSGIAAGGTDAHGHWAAGAGNTFLADIKGGIETVRSNTGIRPNRLTIDAGTYGSLKEESTILDKIKYTERGVLTKELLAVILELDEVIIGEAIVNTAKEAKGNANWAASNVWEVNAGKGMGFLFFAPAAMGLKKPSAGAQARRAYDDGLARRTTTWRETAEHQDVYEVAEETMILQVGPDLGYLWKDTLKD
jgi:hypothetical protein